MKQPDARTDRKSRLRINMLKGVFLYALAPVLLVCFLSQSVSGAVRSSPPSAFLILLAVFCAVILNWLVYAAIHRKHPSLPVFAYGMLCLLATVIIEHEALPGSHELVPTLALIGGCLSIACMLLFSFWFAALPSRPAHVIAVGLRIIIGLLVFFMACQVFRDIESRRVTRDTWISVGVMVAAVLGRNAPRIWSAVRRAILRRRAAGPVTGVIAQIIGETYLDRDEDLATRYFVRVQYMVGDSLYETRTGISRYTVRRFGREAFMGREIPVFYDPANPDSAFTPRIDRHFFDQEAQQQNRQGPEA